MIRRNQSYLLVLCASLVLSSLAGCEDHSSPSSPTPLPPPTEPVAIFVGGQCRVAANAIVCRDASRSDPQGRLSAVDWELFTAATGLSLGTSPGAPGGEISFTGLPAGTYQVNQTVNGQDHSTQSRTYGPLVLSF